MKQNRDPNWCDRCEQAHSDIKSVHCTIGEHCTTTTEVCAIDASHDDHRAVCCDCGTDLLGQYRAQTDTSASPAPQVRRVQQFGKVDRRYADSEYDRCFGTAPRSDGA